MNYVDRLYDDYESHRRRNLNPDELEALVAGLPASKSIQHKDFLDYVGDALISAGNSIKKHHSDRPSTILTQARGDV